MMSTHELVDRCREGDWKAQVELYRVHFQPVFSTCLRLVNNRTDSEDLVQEAFMQAFRMLHTFSDELDFTAWIRRIAINRCLDFLRKRKVELLVHDQNLPENLAEEEDGIDFQESQEVVVRIKKAMTQLADGYRVVLSLHLLEGFDHEEIAGILKVSPSTSRSQYSRARNALLKIISTQPN